LALTNARLPPVDIGSNVVLRVPDDVDRDRPAPRSILAVVYITVLQTKTVHVPEMRPIYSSRYGSIEKRYVRGLSRSKRVA